MKFNSKVVLGVAALVFVLSLCVAFLAPGFAGNSLRALAGVALMVGITITYAYPVSGTTAPTASVMKHKSLLTVTIAMADGDTTATITHNWALTAAELADRFPLVNWTYVTPGTAPALLSFSRAANTVTITKPTGTGTGGTYGVELMRPHTIIR